MDMTYRYYETILSLVNAMVDSAFTACRYAQMPDEATEKYYERRALTSAFIYHTYNSSLYKALYGLVMSPENPPRLGGFDIDDKAVIPSLADDEPNDLYEEAMDLFQETLHNISKDLAVAAYELDIDEINRYFKSLPQSTIESNYDSQFNEGI